MPSASYARTYLYITVLLALTNPWHMCDGYSSLLVEGDIPQHISYSASSMAASGYLIYDLKLLLTSFLFTGYSAG